jgi:hypothetical protein
MTITIGELILSVFLALGIGGLLGMERGYDQACSQARALAKAHRTGELLVQVPAQMKIDATTWGSGWLASKLCEGR